MPFPAQRVAQLAVVSEPSGLSAHRTVHQFEAVSSTASLGHHAHWRGPRRVRWRRGCIAAEAAQHAQHPLELYWTGGRDQVHGHAAREDADSGPQQGDTRPAFQRVTSWRATCGRELPRSGVGLNECDFKIFLTLIPYVGLIKS